jgi:hypothetical protein
VITIDRSLRVLGGRHRLEIRTLTLAAERFDVEYALTPPLPACSAEMVLPRLEATDDQGRTYGSCGGAFGLSDDGTRTLGTLCGQPGLPPDIREVTLRFGFISSKAEDEYELRVPLR